ncbi:MAG: hypothetical protein CMB34_05115 [Euryarchaeota archaeon]|nr:hypothetical protein [Euryarchaeota archaeon]
MSHTQPTTHIMQPSAIATAVVLFVFLASVGIGTLLYCAIDHFMLRPQDQDIIDRAQAVERLRKLR